MPVKPEPQSTADIFAQSETASGEILETCNLSVLANRTPGEVRCPVCSHIVPPEHIGYKLHCRKCGYLESCCNPV